MEITINHVFVGFILINLAITLWSIQSNREVTRMLYWAHYHQIRENVRMYGGKPSPFDPPRIDTSGRNACTGDTGDDPHVRTDDGIVIHSQGNG